MIKLWYQDLLSRLVYQIGFLFKNNTFPKEIMFNLFKPQAHHYRDNKQEHEVSEARKSTF